MADARFFHQQANRCYQLAWQSFDLAVANKLNAIGNKRRRASLVGKKGRHANNRKALD